MAVTKKWLLSRVYTLNEALGRPVEQFASKPGESTRFSIGHIHLDHNYNGYSLEEQTSEQGGVHVMCHRVTAKEMNMLIDGMIKGIGLRNIHIGELLLRAELDKGGLTKEGQQLYTK